MDIIIYILIGIVIGGVTAFSICWSRKPEEDSDEVMKKKIFDTIINLKKDIENKS